IHDWSSDVCSSDLQRRARRVFLRSSTWEAGRTPLPSLVIVLAPEFRQTPRAGRFTTGEESFRPSVFSQVKGGCTEACSSASEDFSRARRRPGLPCPHARSKKQVIVCPKSPGWGCEPPVRCGGPGSQEQRDATEKGCPKSGYESRRKGLPTGRNRTPSVQGRSQYEIVGCAGAQRSNLRFRTLPGSVLPRQSPQPPGSSSTQPSLQSQYPNDRPSTTEPTPARHRPRTVKVAPAPESTRNRRAVQTSCSTVVVTKEARERIGQGSGPPRQKPTARLRCRA